MCYICFIKNDLDHPKLSLSYPVLIQIKIKPCYYAIGDIMIVILDNRLLNFFMIRIIFGVDIKIINYFSNFMHKIMT